MPRVPLLSGSKATNTTFPLSTGSHHHLTTVNSNPRQTPLGSIYKLSTPETEEGERKKMMMLGERNNYPHHFSIPSIQIPPEEENEEDWDEIHPLIDAYSCDEFRMYEFKVRRCGRGRSHDWTECPYVHPGEKARRRDPRKYHYSGTACPDFRKGGCKRGDGCEFAHGVFECWLHPARYRTQPCKDGVGCRRRVCFFAHTPEQLRVVTPCGREIVDGYDGSPMRRKKMVLSPKSTLPGFSGSPTGSDRCGSPPTTVEELLMRMSQMGISKCPTTGNPWPLTRVGSFGWCQSGKEKVFSEDTVDEPEWFSELMN